MKIFMKTTFFVMLLMTLVFILAACGGQESSDVEETTATAQAETTATELVDIDTTALEKFALKMNKAAIEGDFDTFLSNVDPAYLKFQYENEGLSESQLKKEFEKGYEILKEEIVEECGDDQSYKTNLEVQKSRAVETTPDFDNKLDAAGFLMDINLSFYATVNDSDYTIAYEDYDAIGRVDILCELEGPDGSQERDNDWLYVKKGDTWFLAKAYDFGTENGGD